MHVYKILTVGLCTVLLHGHSIAAKHNPLNILFVVNRFPSRSQTFILNIITGLIDRGHNVSIFSFHKDSIDGMHPHIEKYKLLDRVIYGQLPAELPPCDTVFCQFGNVGKKIFAMKRLKKWLKDKKVAVCFRGSDLTAHLKKDPTIYKKLFKKADLIMPVCDYFKKRLITLGCSSHKIVVHHSAIDCSQFFFKTRIKPADGAINLISVCRLVEKKGIDTAIRAVARVIRTYSDVHYTIVGDGPERSYLENLIRELNIVDNVTMYGWGTQNQVVEMLNRSHIFLLPSLTASDGNEEGIANALKEAMAAGLLAVSTWHAGTPELIDNGVSGFLVHEGNDSELADTIEYIIENSAIWESVGLAARKKIEEEFETQKTNKRLEELFYWLMR